MTNIYALLEPKSDIIKYVGMTINKVEDRITTHLCPTNLKRECLPKVKWFKKMRNSGVRPDYLILDVVENDQASFWEQHYIALFKTWGFDLTNTTPGGIGNTSPTRSEEQKEKIREKTKGRRLSEMTDAGRKAISQKMKMRYLKNPKSNPFYGVSKSGSLNPNAKKVDMLDLDGNHLKTFECAIDARKSISKGDINKCLSQPITSFGVLRTAGGYRWKYTE